MSANKYPLAEFNFFSFRISNSGFLNNFELICKILTGENPRNIQEIVDAVAGFTNVVFFNFSGCKLQILQEFRSEFRWKSSSMQLLSILTIKFIYSEKATKLCKISNVDLTGTTWDKSTMEILQNFMAF